jgi:hypothetical protein
MVRLYFTSVTHGNNFKPGCCLLAIVLALTWITHAEMSCPMLPIISPSSFFLKRRASEEVQLSLVPVKDTVSNLAL